MRIEEMNELELSDSEFTVSFMFPDVTSDYCSWSLHRFMAKTWA